VLISPEDLASLEETLALLADSDALRDLWQAQQEIARGECMRGVEAVRALRPRRR
jgi:PHD/YefM family antitoxin component YafN of YafNO toxin-antitoxin module